MKRAVSSFLFGLLACGAVALAAEPKFIPAPDGSGIAGEYIVVLQQGMARDPLQPGSSGSPSAAEVARRLTARYGGTVERIYEHALLGFTVRLPEEAARRLAADPAVELVEQNARVETSTIDSCYTGANNTPNFRGLAVESRDPVDRPFGSPETIDCVDPDPIRRNGDPAAPPGDPHPGYSISCRDNWGLDIIDGARNGRYDYAKTGQGVHVYLIDLGINKNHREFLDLGTPGDLTDTRVKEGFNAAALDSDSSAIKDNVNDCATNSHGTHVAAIVAGNTFGVAKRAWLHPVKFADACNSRNGSRDTVINGVDWILSKHNQSPEHMGPAVVNFSGGNGGDPSFRDGVMAVWVRRLLMAGISFVQSVGNQDNANGQNSCLNTLASTTSLRDALIVVGGIDQSGRLDTGPTPTYYRWQRESGDPSSPLCTGSPFDCGSNFGSCVDLWAPGAHIVSAMNVDNTSACRLSGTSMAAPHVTGVVAQLLERFPLASPSTVKKALVASARPNVLQAGTIGDSPNLLLFNQFPATGGPVAGDLWLTTPPGVVKEILIDDLLRGDLDWSGYPLQLTAVGNPAHGLLQTLGNRLVYTPYGGFIGVDSFSYTVSDGHGGTATAVVRIDVNQQPQPPVAHDDCYETAANTAINLYVSPAPCNLKPCYLNNDVDPDGDLLSSTHKIVQQPAHGTVDFGLTSADYLYTPASGFVGTDTFRYVVRDSYYQKSEATVTVHVGSGSCPVDNQAPAPQDDYFSTPFNTSVPFFVSTLLANDTDPDGDAISFDGLITLPTHGFISVDGVAPEDIIYRYTPNTSYIGADSLVYQVRDARGAVGTATVHFTVTSAGFHGNPDAFVVNVNGLLRVLSSQLTANDSPGAVFIRAENAVHGSLTIGGIAPEGVLYDFYPEPNYIGEAGFDYLISPDGNPPYTVVHVVIQVVDGAPTAAFTASCTGTACSFDGSASSDDVGVVSYAWNFGDGTTGTAPTLSHTFTRGWQTVTLQVTDGRGQSDTETRQVLADARPVPSFTVSCTGRTCTFNASASTDDGTITLYTWNFGDTTSAAVTTPTITHDYTSSGTFSVTLTVTDDAGQAVQSNSQTARADLDPNPCFTWTRDGLTITFNATCSTDDLGITSYAWNFGDGTRGTGVTISRTYATSGSFPAQLTVTDNGGHPKSTLQTVLPDAKPVGCFTYSCTLRTCTFNASCSTDNQPLSYSWSFGDSTTGSGSPVTHVYAKGGLKTVVLTVTDSVGQTGSQTQNVPVNRPPVAVNDSASATQNVTLDVNVLANDSDPDNDSITASAWTQPAHGTVTKNPNGTMHYVPVTGYLGGDSFTYQISDSKEPSNWATVTITVNVPNNPPDARDDGWSTYQNGPTNIPYVNLLANDYDVNGDTLTVSGVNTAGLTGTLDCSFGTYCRFTPPSWFVGTTSFAYTASDGKGGTDPATVRIKVGVANNAPAPQDDILETTRNTALVFTQAALLLNDTDADGDVLSVSSVYRAPLTAFGTVSCSAGFYKCTYTPPTGFTGVDVLYYRASDGITFTDARLRILVRPPTPAVLDAHDDAMFSTTTTTYLSYTWMTSNDYTPAGGALTVVGVDTAGLLGTLDCTTYSTGCEYTRGTNDPTRFRYTVRDAQGNQETVTVTLKPGNQAFNKFPVVANDQLSTRTNTPLTFSVFDVLRNDYDPDNDALNVIFNYFSSSGHVLCTTPAYSCTYTPNAGFTGTDTLTYTVNDGNNAVSGTVTMTVQPVIAKDAQILSQSVPVSMFAGQTYPVSLRIKNVGTQTWGTVGPQCNAFRLGSANPQDNTTWGPGRTELPAAVAPGGEVTLTFNITAPATPGTYNFQRRMLHECVEWFGDLSPNVVVSVVNP